MRSRAARTYLTQDTTLLILMNDEKKLLYNPQLTAISLVHKTLFLQDIFVHSNFIN